MKKALAAGVAMAMALSMASMGAMAEDNAVDVKRNCRTVWSEHSRLVGAVCKGFQCGQSWN